jgi:S-formylglutathione hydrolase FrmB
VTQFVDSTYRTLARRESRAIGGYSMGGYGSFTIAARFPEVFSVAVSHGGVLTPGLLADSTTLATTGQVTWRIGRSNAELRKAAGPNEWGAMIQMFGVDSSTFHARDPASLFLAVKARGAAMPLLYADAAMDDERLEQNAFFRATLEANHIPLVYAEWKGKHTWKYVQAHMPEGLHFIADRMTR